MGNVNSGARSGHSSSFREVADALSRNPVAVSQVLMFQSATTSDSSTNDVTTETDSKAGTPEADIGYLQRQDLQLSLWFNYLENGQLPTNDHTAQRLVLKQDQFQTVYSTTSAHWQQDCGD